VGDNRVYCPKQWYTAVAELFLGNWQSYYSMKFHNQGKKLAIRSVSAFLLLLTFAQLDDSCAWSKATATASGFDGPLVSSDTKARLLQIDEKRKELHERAVQTRRKEQIALLKLNRIESKLNVTTGALIGSKKELKKTEHKIDEVQQHITKTYSDQINLSQSAAQRLREIYEGQHLSFVEMLFEVESLQAFLDRCYYQERIAELDKQLLTELRAKAALLAVHKDKLGEKRNQLGDLVSEFARKAMAIAKQKFDQEQIASRLRTQRTFFEQAERQLASESHQLETQIIEMESSNRKNSKNMLAGSGQLAMPLVAQVTSPFGWRQHPIFGVRRFHTGIDLAGPNHAAIRSADSGAVLYTGWYGGYGKVVIVSHGKGMATLYAHLSKIATSQGNNVSKGDVLGYEGTTGFSTGPHLHFEVRMNGKPNNPLNYFH
jgi:murein DD-endopeptidase MepM/ murein hydrolase activator NlpD